MTVRRFVEQDRPVVEVSVPERQISSVHRERIARQHQGECTYLLAFNRDRPVGWVLLLTNEDPWSEWRQRYACAEVEDLYVSPAARRQRHGTDLLLAAEGTAREMGFRSIGLSAGGENDPDSVAARRLYERAGYQDVARGDWLVGWSWTGNDGARRGDWLLLGSYFLKDLARLRCSGG